MKKYLLVLLIASIMHTTGAKATQLLTIEEIEELKQQTVTVRNNVTVSNEYITLGDLFDGLTQKADTVIARAPAPGQEVRVNTGWLEKVAVKHEINWEPSNLYAKTTIKSASDIISADEIVSVIKDELSNEGYNKNDIEISLTNKMIQVHIPENSMHNIIVKELSLNSRANRFAANISINPDSDYPKNVTVNGRIFETVTVPVLKSGISRGSLIKPDDIDTIRLRNNMVRRNHLLDMHSLIGMEARRTIRAGQPIQRMDIAEHKIIKKGQAVTINLHNKFMKLSTIGVALEDGSSNSLIKVKNIQSKKTVIAKVIDEENVTVNLRNNHSELARR